MDCFQLAYEYVISTVVGILIALCVGLMTLRVSSDTEFASYRKARRLLAALFAVIIADLVLSLAAYKAQTPGNLDTLIAIFCYTLVAILYSQMIDALLDNTDHGRPFTITCAIMWVVSFTTDGVNELLKPDGYYRQVFMACVVLWVCTIIAIATKILLTFRETSRRMDDIYSDGIAGRIAWMRNSIMMFLAWGVISPLATMGPSWLNTIYTALGGAVYLYLGISFFNYGTEHKRVKTQSRADAEEPAEVSEQEAIAALKTWEEGKEYRKPCITIDMMSASLNIPPRSLISAISSQRNGTFRDYVSRLRVRDAQELLIHFTDKEVGEIATMVGFKTRADMDTAFRETVYVSPEEWRAGVLRLIN